MFFYLYYLCFFLMIRRPPRSTRTDTLFPYTTLFRSLVASNVSLYLASAWNKELHRSGQTELPSGSPRQIGRSMLRGRLFARGYGVTADRKSTRLNSSH